MRPKYVQYLKVVAGLVVAFGAGFWVAAWHVVPFAPGVPAAASGAPAGVDLGPLYDAWTILQDNYASASTTAVDVTTNERLYGAIKGLANAYGDPYTTFFPPIEKKFFDSEVAGNFEGVGMEIGIKDGILTVVAPIKDTPAYRAGITEGDLIIAIDGTDTSGMSTDVAVSKIRGPKDTVVKLTLVRGGGKPFDVSVTRDTILLPTVDTQLKDGVFVIHLYSFDALAAQDFRDAVRQFADSGSPKMLIDLRGNPGGYLEAAVDIASWFLPVGKPVVTEAHKDESQTRVYRSRGYDVFTDQVKVAILMDKGSASAAEILAGALHDYGIATLIGSQSFGKGSVQQVFPVTADTSIKVTVARWLTPNGTSISHVGLTPDIKVERTEEDFKAGRDPQLDRAVEFLNTGK